MIAKYGGVISRVMLLFHRMHALAEEFPKQGEALAPGAVEGRIKIASDGVGLIQDGCLLLGFHDFEPAIARMRHQLEIAHILPPAALSGDLKALKERFEDRIKTEWFFHLAPGDNQLYGDKELFGERVTKKFPKALGDIEAAGSCLALGQGTACVFHLMRAMEVVVQRLSGRLSIPYPDREWGKLLSDISKKIEAMPKVSASEKRKRNKWSEAHTHLYHLKQAWRNDTMHPKSTYTQEHARQVFNATRVFMNHLAGLV